MTVQEAKERIDLAEVVQAAGVELIRRRSRHAGLCPFHAEKTPSFYVFPDGHYHCFGCHAHGDTISFIQKLHGLTFPEALRYLGIEQDRSKPKIKKDIQRRKRRAELIKKFRDWEQWYGTEVSDLWFQTKRLMANGIPPENLDLYAPLFHMLPIWEHHREILIHGTDHRKFELYKEVQRCRKTISI